MGGAAGQKTQVKAGANLGGGSLQGKLLHVVWEPGPKA